MFRGLTRAAPILLVSAAAACSDPMGPCERRRACEIGGVDLAITSARIVAGERTGTDDVTGLPIFAPGPVTVEFTVTNRGDSTSAPQPVVQSDAVLPALAPGETATFVVTEDYTDAVHIQPTWYQPVPDARTADQRVIEGILLQRGVGSAAPEHWPVSDSDVSNNRRLSPAFHVAMPVLAARMSEVATVRANHPFVVSFRIENVSVHGGNAGPFDVVLCAWDGGGGCYPSRWTTFGRFEIPGIHSGWRYENAYAPIIELSATPAPHAARPAVFSLCIVGADDDSAHLTPPPDCVAWNLGETMVRPDYVACSPPILQPGVNLDLSGTNCGDHAAPALSNRTFAVVALDAEAGHTYTLTGASVAAYDANGVSADLPGPGLSFAETGRYYLVFHPSGPVTLRLTEE